MTEKITILRMVQRMEDDVTYNAVMYHLAVMRWRGDWMEQAKERRGHGT